MCMSISIYMCRNMYINIYIYTHINVYVYIHIYICICVGVYVYIYKYICVCVGVHVYIYIYIDKYIYIYIYIHIHIYSNIYIYVYIYVPPDPTNHVKIFKGHPLRFALWELVPNRYKSFPRDHFGQGEINDSTLFNHACSTMLSIKPVPLNLVRRIRSWSI